MMTNHFFSVIAGLLLSTSLHAEDFKRWSNFKSPAAFAEAAKAFKPAAARTDLSSCFTTRDLGQLDDPKTGKPIAAPAIESCEILWSDDAHALVFATAVPPIEATKAKVGALFLLGYNQCHWQIDDLLPCTATGKYSDVSAKLDAATDSNRPLKTDEDTIYVTVSENQGGRGRSYSISATYVIQNRRLQRQDLE